MFRSLGVQVVVYRNDHDQLVRLAQAIAATVRNAREETGLDHVSVLFGDCHQPATLGESAEALRSVLADDVERVEFIEFDDNLGSAGGSNALAAEHDGEVIWVLNPDTYPQPRCATQLLEALGADGVVAAEARQIPLEHPKHYDEVSGDTSWASGACVMFRRDAFDAVGGFDAHFFPMYCDDVDLSWRLRHGGGRVVHVPRAAVFHDKRVDAERSLVASDLERRSGALARLFLARRYGRPDIEHDTLSAIAASDGAGTDAFRAAVDEFTERDAAGDVPDPIESPGTVAQFVDGEYAEHRFFHFA